MNGIFKVLLLKMRLKMLKVNTIKFVKMLLIRPERRPISNTRTGSTAPGLDSLKEKTR